MARRRAEEIPPEADAAGAAPVPDCLRAGACVEVWDPTGLNTTRARVRWNAARRVWLERHALGAADYARWPSVLQDGGSRAPWSFSELAQTPGRLAQRLAVCGLPADWQPAPAPADWLRAVPAPALRAVP